jgi:hypothetical protein
MLLTGNMQPAAAEVPASAAQAGETLRLGRLPLLATQALPALLASFRARIVVAKAKRE